VCNQQNGKTHEETHRSHTARPRMAAFFTNMSAPMPWHYKAYLLLRNNALKMWHRRSCCGHPGQPGC